MRGHWYPPPSKPRAVEGGLQVRSRRGSIGESWWSERFVAVLEDIGLGNRLRRGRTYARKGQVMSLEVDAGSVTALVQGSRARPYRVRIGVTAFGKAEWARVEQALADDAWYAAQLLAGAMPEDIEDIFARVDLALFPLTARDLSMDCSCPDVAVPCKHVAAAFYLLAEAFDDDPFSILAWRGRDREDLLANLRSLRSSGPPAADAAERTGKPLDECLDDFFQLQASVSVRRPPSGGRALLDQLPPVPLDVRGTPMVELLRPAYSAFMTDITPESEPTSTAQPPVGRG